MTVITGSASTTVSTTAGVSTGRAARSWDDAAAEILAGRGRQFDPDVVDAFREREPVLRGIRRELAVA